MKLKSIILIFTILLLFSCKNKTTDKETFYLTPNGKIITVEEYESMKINLSKNGKLVETVISTVEREDSIIKEYKIYVLPLDYDENFNPFVEAERFIGKTLPFNSLKAMSGDLINLESIYGKPTLVNFWFTTCKPCIEEMPALNKLKEEYGKSVNFLAITFETEKKAKSFLKTRAFDFTHITDAKREIDDIGNESYPMNMFLDKDGIIRFVTGNLIEKDGKDFKIIIDELL